MPLAVNAVPKQLSWLRLRSRTAIGWSEIVIAAPRMTTAPTLPRPRPSTLRSVADGVDLDL